MGRIRGVSCESQSCQSQHTEKITAIKASHRVSLYYFKNQDAILRIYK